MQMKRFMASQLRRPHGWFGSFVVCRLMNRVNRKIVDTTLDLLNPSPGHHVLEIGFGGGSALANLTKRLSSGIASGVDVSPDMVHQAERRFRREIAQGRITVKSGDIANLPFPDSGFDRVFTINTVYFWADALQGLGEIRRVLKDGGLAAISLRSKEKMQNYEVTKYNFHLFQPQEVADLMRQVGFRDVRIDHRDQQKWTDQAVVRGLR
ncbi:MAG: class I SAM-dependent methyltransferase [Candidatus Acidiferrum sp.]